MQVQKVSRKGADFSILEHFELLTAYHINKVVLSNIQSITFRLHG